MLMNEKLVKRYLFASDFDQTLSFNDSGLVLAELLGISAEEFNSKTARIAELNLFQQGTELTYLLLHDPHFHSRVRRELLLQAGKRISLKENTALFYKLLGNGIDRCHFDSFVLSAAPLEIVQSALVGIVPADHIFGTEFKYNTFGEIEMIDRATAGYGKVARLEQLQSELEIGPGNLIYAGDESSDLHAMLYVNGCEGLTIAVSESRNVPRIAQRTIMSSNAVAMFTPILEKVGWLPQQIREFFESNGLLVQEWKRSR